MEHLGQKHEFDLDRANFMHGRSASGNGSLVSHNHLAKKQIEVDI
jgi:hypothetical protein